MQHTSRNLHLNTLDQILVPQHHLTDLLSYINSIHDGVLAISIIPMYFSQHSLHIVTDGELVRGRKIGEDSGTSKRRIGVND